MNADVVAVAVQEPYLEWTPRSTRNSWRGDIEQEIEQWIAPISATGVAVTSIVERDLHAANGLIGVASAHHGDLLVIGTRGAGGFTGLRLGGVAMKVLHGVAIPLVLVPPAG
jgi:nucleotide-binding universal stress UspA family protein